MKTLDRYVIGMFLNIFLLIVVSLIGLYLIVDFFERIRMFISNDATASQIVLYFAYQVPFILSLMIPVSVLLSSLLTFGILSKNSELIAMKANGVSLYRTSYPIILFAAVICLLSFFLNEFVTPFTNQRAKYIKLVEVQKRERVGVFKQNQIWFRGQDGIYNFDMVDPASGTLTGVRISYLDHYMNLTKRIDAARAVWGNSRWIFYDALVATFETNGLPVLQRSDTLAVDLPEKPSDFTSAQKDADEMGYFELRNYIKKIRSEGYDATRYVADAHGKIAFSLVSVILAVIGISFSLSKSERSGGISQSIAIGIVIGFSYWIVHAFALSLGRSGSLQPLVAAWTANMLFGAGALYLFMKVRT
ncbi:MAG: LPS export ABC transporter permease LptG [Deltaproteobacteria bacterium]|nr:LPS export ABC transporter permease LptG [Deltaproteobacteria bacterium]MBN2688258.1 LPS export ABC transporter permease LptG [Deltaproteobacteria bacterium]